MNAPKVTQLYTPADVCFAPDAKREGGGPRSFEHSPPPPPSWSHKSERAHTPLYTELPPKPSASV